MLIENESFSGSAEDLDSIIRIKNLTFSYSYRGNLCQSTALNDVSMSIPRNARVLVVGGNGAGKSTLMKAIGGRIMIPRSAVTVLGRPAFHDTTLVRDVGYLGEWWQQTYVDITVGELIADLLQDSDIVPRVNLLLHMLQVETSWRMSFCSDGQRRRVQILMGLARPKTLYLLDEVTTDLDLITRYKIITFLKEESLAKGCTILYCTHIFDGIEDLSPTHIIRTCGGKAMLINVADCAALQELFREGSRAPWYELAKGWLLEEGGRIDGPEGSAEAKAGLPWQLRHGADSGLIIR